MYSITPTELLTADEAFDKLHITQQELDQWESEGKIISFKDDYGNKQYYFHELAGWQTQKLMISQGEQVE
jgi:hypothetical protein